tara:strand:+ start:874 stop:1818 length:945 start_codon:yes stop_codon:yes gene_type:complete
MKLISFDVGIKNMAYCVLECDSDQVTINEWGVLNLMDDDIASHVCGCMNTPKSKKAIPKACTKKAKYLKHDIFYCDKHALACSQYIIPTKQHSITSLKKLKLDDLIAQGNHNLVFLNVDDVKKLKKPVVLELVLEYYKQKCFEVVANKKKRTAGETDLISVGRKMKEQLNNLDNIINIDHAIIENQISPIATRMKTVQGMLAQYFIMMNDNTNIQFVSSSHKLKQFSEFNLEKREQDESVTDSTRTNPNYKKHKLDGVYYCSRMIDANEQMIEWKESLNTKKKDDLADSFLQGIWYLKHNNIISFAEDLKIKIV